MKPHALVQKWAEQARLFEEFGANAQAHTLRIAAAELQDALRAAQEEVLTLQQASELTGYSTDHLGRLIREEQIPNAGRKGAPRIRRSDLPVKPGRITGTVAGYKQDRLFRDIADSKFGEDDVAA